MFAARIKEFDVRALEEGIRKGFENGRRMEKIHIIKNMQKDGVDEKKICLYCDLSMDELEKILGKTKV